VQSSSKKWHIKDQTLFNFTQQLLHTHDRGRTYQAECRCSNSPHLTNNCFHLLLHILSRLYCTFVVMLILSATTLSLYIASMMLCSICQSELVSHSAVHKILTCWMNKMRIFIKRSIRMLFLCLWSCYSHLFPILDAPTLSSPSCIKYPVLLSTFPQTKKHATHNTQSQSIKTHQTLHFHENCKSCQ